MELLTPARTAEAVVAAVQSGADAISILPRHVLPDGTDTGLTDAELKSAVRYCRVRGCRVYLSLDEGYADDELPAALEQGRRAAELGVSGVILSDMGLARAMRAAAPDLKLLGGDGLDVHNLAGARAAAELGFHRVRLARELNAAEIRAITAGAGLETEVLIHGDQCVCRDGQCALSALTGEGSAWKGVCAQPCRRSTSMGGRMDDHPLSMKRVCLAEHLRELSDAGVHCARLGEMDLPTEYAAYLTELYAGLIHENRRPTPGELERLYTVFPRETVSDGYYTGAREGMFLPPVQPDREVTRSLADVRKRYTDEERRRVPVTFYAVIRGGEPSRFAAEDGDGNRVVLQGPVPRESLPPGLSAAAVEEQLHKTAGTPYRCEAAHCAVDPALWLEAEELAHMRRELIGRISEMRRTPPRPREGTLPPPPVDLPGDGAPELIFQITRPDQLTEELAALLPAMLYAPLELLAEDYSRAAPFFQRGIPVAAVLPRVVTDGETGRVREMLAAVKALGVDRAVINSLGHLRPVRESGLSVRGDYGLNVRNSYAMGILDDAGFESATVSFELRLEQIGRLCKPIPAEMLVYGRLPVMVTEACLIKNSALRCSCDSMNNLSDRRGSAFPVTKEFGCRNLIYNARKLYLGDRQEDYAALGLRYARLLFTGESDRECVQVAKSFLGLSAYRPNSLTRGLYYRRPGA